MTKEFIKRKWPVEALDTLTTLTVVYKLYRGLSVNKFTFVYLVAHTSQRKKHNPQLAKIFFVCLLITLLKNVEKIR